MHWCGPPIDSLTANVSGAIVVALLDNGIWSVQRALAFSRGMTNVQRVPVLLAVARLDPDRIDEVLSTAEELGPTTAHLQVLSGIGTQDNTRRAQLSHTALSMFPRACRVPNSAESVNAILPILTDAQVQELTETLLTMTHTHGRANALLAIALSRPSAQRTPLLLKAADAASAIGDPEVSCDVLLSIARASSDGACRDVVSAQAQRQANLIAEPAHKMIRLISTSGLLAPPQRHVLHADILAAIDDEIQEATRTGRGQPVHMLCYLVEEADEHLLDQLASWVINDPDGLWKRGSSLALNGVEFMTRLARRLDDLRKRELGGRALAAIQDCTLRPATIDEERVAVELLSDLPSEQIDQWAPLEAKLSALGRLHLAIATDDRRRHLNLADTAQEVATALTCSAFNDLGRVMDFADQLPARELLTPLRATAAPSRVQYSWLGLLAALPRLLAAFDQVDDELHGEFFSVVTELIANSTGYVRLAAAEIVAPQAPEAALQELLSLQMHIADTVEQLRTLSIAAAHLDDPKRKPWTALIRQRLDTKHSAVDIATNYPDLVAALLPLLGAEEVLNLANVETDRATATTNNTKVLAQILHRLCELDCTDDAVALLHHDQNRYLSDTLATSLAAAAAATGNARLNTAVLSILRDGNWDFPRLLNLPEQWRAQNPHILRPAAARWLADGQFDPRNRFRLEVAAAGLAYIDDQSARAELMESIWAALTDYTQPENRGDTLVRLLTCAEPPPAPAIVELALTTLRGTTDILDPFVRRRLLVAVAPHLPPDTLTDLLFTVFGNGNFLDETLAAAIAGLDDTAVRHLYQAVATRLHTSGRDTISHHDKLARALMPRCLIALAHMGYVEECLQQLEQPPANDPNTVRTVIGAIAERIPQQFLDRASTLIRPPDTPADSHFTLAPLALREANCHGALPQYKALSGDGPVHIVGPILPGLVPHLLKLPEKDLYRPTADLLRHLQPIHRSSLLKDLGALAPLIAYLGGQPAIQATAEAILEIGEWFP